MINRVLRIQTVIQAIIALAIVIGPALVFGSAQVETLEKKLRSYLDTVMNSDDYLLYITQKVDAKKSATALSSIKSEEYPGMGNLGRQPDEFVDTVGMTHDIDAGPLGAVSVNLIVDKRINRQKILVIKNAIIGIARLNTASGDEVKISQAAISRESPNMPQEHRSPEKTWIDSLAQNNREVLIILFAILLSVLMVTIVHGFTKRFLAPPQVSPENNSSRVKEKPAESKSEAIDAGAGKPGTATSSAAKRAELYSKDSAIYKLIQEIYEEAKMHPKKIAKIISEWLQRGDDGITRSSVFFQNFDIKTAELIGKELTPSDMELLGKQVHSDFDMFSEENIKVIYLARQELTRIASYSTKVTHAEPLKFLHLVGDDILAEILRNESIEDLALILTQVPGHRVSHFLNNLDQITVDNIFEQLSQFNYVDESQFISITQRLQSKIEQYSKLAFTPKTKEIVMANMIKQFTNTEQQRLLLERLSSKNKELVDHIKENLLLYEDLFALPDRLLKTLVSEVDPQTLARALRGESSENVTQIASALPKATKEIFEIEVASPFAVSEDDIKMARQSLLAKAHELLGSGILNFEDIKAARKLRQQLKDVRKVG